MDIHRFYGWLRPRFRRERMRRFLGSLGIRGDTRVVDLGGTPPNWELVADRPQVTLVNMSVDFAVGAVRAVCADALRCPFPDKAFDVVFSNSLIEHLETWERQVHFADEVRRLGRGYFVQTPNKWFPIEPHYLAPFVQFAPQNLRPWIVRWLTPRGWLEKPSKDDCHRMVKEIRLLGPREMHRLFPEAKIIREKFLGLTKSIIAISPN
jgi:Methyltransferase domain